MGQTDGQMKGNSNTSFLNFVEMGGGGVGKNRTLHKTKKGPLINFVMYCLTIIIIIEAAEMLPFFEYLKLTLVHVTFRLRQSFRLRPSLNKGSAHIQKARYITPKSPTHYFFHI